MLKYRYIHVHFNNLSLPILCRLKLQMSLPHSKRWQHRCWLPQFQGDEGQILVVITVNDWPLRHLHSIRIHGKAAKKKWITEKKRNEPGKKRRNKPLPKKRLTKNQDQMSMKRRSIKNKWKRLEPRQLSLVCKAVACPLDIHLPSSLVFL